MSAGVQSVISFKKESTWGTAVTPDKSIPVRPTGGLEIKNNIQMQPAIMGRLQKYYEAIKGKVMYEGDYTMDLFGDYIGYFILSAMGVDTPALKGGESVVYEHVFTESATKPSLTIEQAIGENIRRYAGCIVSGFKVTGKAGEMLQFSPSIMAKTQASASAISPAFSTVPAFNHAQLAVKIGGSTIAEVESIEFEYKNGLDLRHALGNVEPAFASIAGGSEVGAKLELYLDSTSLTELTNYINKTTRSLQLIATGGAIGSAANYVFDLTIPKAVYTAGATKVTDAANLLTIEAQGVYDISTSKLLALTTTNLLSAYS